MLAQHTTQPWRNDGNLYPQSSSAKVGIGTQAADYGLRVSGLTSTSGIRSDMGVDLNPVPRPTTAISLALINSAGNLGIGRYYYWYTFVTALGETRINNTSTSIITTAGNQQVTVTFPVSTDYRVIARRLYRTTVDGATWVAKLLTTINDNTTTTFIDNVADGSLGADNFFRKNTTAPIINMNGTVFFYGDDATTTVGYGAGGAITTGGDNTLFGAYAGQYITTGAKSVLIGYGAGSSFTTQSSSIGIGWAALQNSTGEYLVGIGREVLAGASGNKHYNVAIGGRAGYLATGSYNTLIGYQAGYNIGAGANSIFLGCYSGYYETASNKLIIDAFDRSTEARGRAEAIIYGITSATPANQILSLGGGGKVGIGTTTPGYKLQVDGIIAPKTDGQGLGVTSTLRWDAYIKVLAHEGTTAGFFGTAPTTKATALTAADSSAINSGDATTDTVIANMRTRINELETKLQAYGLLS